METTTTINKFFRVISLRDLEIFLDLDIRVSQILFPSNIKFKAYSKACTAHGRD